MASFGARTCSGRVVRRHWRAAHRKAQEGGCATFLSPSSAQIQPSLKTTTNHAVYSPPLWPLFMLTNPPKNDRGACALSRTHAAPLGDDPVTALAHAVRRGLEASTGGSVCHFDACVLLLLQVPPGDGSLAPKLRISTERIPRATLRQWSAWRR